MLKVKIKNVGLLKEIFSDLQTRSLKVIPAGLPKNLHDVQLSVILIGDSNTGKTSLVARFADADDKLENYEKLLLHGEKVIICSVVEVDVRSEIEKGVFHPTNLLLGIRRIFICHVSCLER